jgi:hypothetical protein
MRAARWKCAVVLCAIAACQVDATSVHPDATTSVQADEVEIAGECRPILTRRCVATNCGHFCSDDVQVPAGHLINSFGCVSSATSCEVTYTTCDPNTGEDDPPPPPASFDCANDQCPAPVQPRVCVASACNLDCDDNVRSQVPSGWKVISETCSSSDPNACSDSITVCDPGSGQTFPIQSGLSCPPPPTSCNDRPTQTLQPCATTCGHSCAADVVAQMGPGERIVGTGCISGPSGHPTECQALLETCDANGNEHQYDSHYDDPCCGDPCCGDACCGDPCCGDPCCGDPCCGDECCGDPCCGDPCCGDPCCGDPCCGDPCCGDPCCGDECCSDGTGCQYGFTGPSLDGSRSDAARPNASPLGGPRAVGSGAAGAGGGRRPGPRPKAGPRTHWPASPFRN